MEIEQIRDILKNWGVYYPSEENIQTTNKIGKSIIWIDDDEQVIANLVWYLYSATKGRLEILIQEKTTSLVDVANKIEASSAEIVLMDYQLQGYTGVEIAKELIRRGSKKQILGFSSISYGEEEFENLGINSILKNCMREKIEKMLGQIEQASK